MQRSRYAPALPAAVGSLSLATVKQALTGASLLEGVGESGFAGPLFKLVLCGALPGSTLSPSDPAFYRFHHAQLISEHVERRFADLILAERCG